MTDRFCDPYDPAFLGSGHHRIIEASAGTGKTHFIEEQVLFWILHGAHLQGSEKHKVPEIHEVLVLTFTEKATGELKIRIRQRLARFVKEGIESLTVRLPAGADELEMRKRANRALKRFDSACIFTIHGFCNHIIRTTGLAGDADFKIEQNDLLRQEALAETVRKYLLSWFEHRLPLALSISGFFDYRRGYSSESFAFDQQLLNLLEHIREEGLPLDFSDGNVSNLSSGVEILSESKTEPKQELEKGPETESDAVPESETKPEPELDREPEAQDLFQYYEQNSTNPGATSTEASETTEPAIRARIQDLNQRIMDLDQSLLFAASRLKEKMDAHWLQGPPGKEGVLYQDIFAARKQFNTRIRSVSLPWLESIRQLLEYLLDNVPTESANLWPLFQSAGEQSVQNMGPSIDPSWEKVDSAAGFFLLELIELWEAMVRLSRPFYERFMELCSLQVDHITAQWKRNNRSLEFQDLLRFVDREVRRQPELPELLRGRFPFAVIDEFQDTDPVQWSIFKHIYLVPDPGASITVVGDPKQSIYGFRGADISAYGMAQQAIVQNGLEGRLALSYRSSPGLLSAFDAFFSHKNWFGDLYHSVKAAPEDKRKWKWEGEPGAPPVEVHDLKDAGNQTYRMFETGRIIAGDIRNIAGKLNLLERDKSRTLVYEDLAILVSRNRDARLIERVLRERSIPCSIYKEAGLYTSVPAYEFLVLLHSLRDLNRHYRQLRLTSYFPAPVVSVASLAEPGSDHPVVRILDQLRELALGGRWANFFRELMESTFVLQKRESNHLYEARISVTLQLLEEFSEYALGYGCSLEELIQYVQRAAYGAEVQQDLMRRKRENPGVSIMTIHASKGLQFPVVFSALQFTGKSGAPEILRYQGTEGMKLSLSHDEQRVELHKLESLNEDRRLAYVAFTRAALKLYVYFVSDAKSIHPLQKEVLEPIFSQIQETESAKELIRFRNAPSAGIDAEETAPSISEAQQDFQIDSPSLRLDFERKGIHSFSSLISRIGSSLESRSLQEKLQEMLSPARIPATNADSAEVSASSSEELPAGIDFGLMVHSILEDIDFASVDEELRAIVIRRARQYFPERAENTGFIQALETMIQNTLSAALPGCDMPLAELSATDRLAEMEFFLSSDTAEIQRISGIDPGQYSEIYLRGFVDLIFRKDDRYYLLDWKTNRLPSYDSEQLQKEMKHHRYDVQARIYFQAMRKWLESVIPGFEPALHLGGAYYLFVRGMQPGSPEGILYLSPEELDV